ncbi:glutamine amidotransferase-related protein [Cohnella thermotolerans]|uniref:glutamine amidotransferase-related protein n=1 Tax=Cohnella thermotolerans TaxID=329858 RepID=UPI000686D9FE|nr:hypothetical protein [Cohnella thermotolerans]
MAGALNAIRYARTNCVPLLGTCGGFQHMVLEYARNVLGLADADHAEENPSASVLMVVPLTCSVSETTNTFRLVPESRVAALYGKEEIEETYGTCNYGVNPAWAPLLEQNELRTVGVDTEGVSRIMELDSPADQGASSGGGRLRP